MPKVALEHAELLDATKCYRCGEALNIRTRSFFTGEPIGKVCMDAETVLKQSIDDRGLRLEKFRGCGYIPNPKKGFKK